MALNTDVILTCAVTGGGDTVGKHPNIPVTPEQIAAAAIEAGEAGAAVAHIHVRDVETGKGGRDRDCFKKAIDIIRSSNTDIVLNLTTGMGGEYTPSDEDPAVPTPDSDFVGPEERVKHVEELRPEICTLDCGTMNFGGDGIAMNTPKHLARMAELVRDVGTKPEIEVFDLGQVWLAKKLIDDGLIDSPPLFQLCMGIPWGAEADPRAMALMRDSLPADAHWAGFGISRMQMPMVAQAMLLGGHCRVGLEDNLYLERGVLASNGELVSKAKHIIEQLGGRTVSADEARSKLGLGNH
jgi:uncharacterized protein (DUF849 family)